jgi:hypothetical protein
MVFDSVWMHPSQIVVLLAEHCELWLHCLPRRSSRNTEDSWLAMLRAVQISTRHCTPCTLQPRLNQTILQASDTHFWRSMLALLHTKFINSRDACFSQGCLPPFGVVYGHRREDCPSLHFI